MPDNKEKGWSPGSWLLAQDAHFAWGLAITFGIYATHLPLWLIPVILLAELIFKEALFDQIVEKNPLVPDGLFDWAFYVLGAWLAYLLVQV